jgi:hypothetical protein
MVRNAFSFYVRQLYGDGTEYLGSLRLVNRRLEEAGPLTRFATIIGDGGEVVGRLGALLDAQLLYVRDHGWAICGAEIDHLQGGGQYQAWLLRSADECSYGMFEVVRARHKGRQIPRWQHARLRRCVGWLSVEDDLDLELNRLTRIAKMVDETGEQKPGFPALRDFELVEAQPHAWSVRGYEQDQPGEQLYSQSWILRPPTVHALDSL